MAAAQVGLAVLAAALLLPHATASEGTEPHDPHSDSAHASGDRKAARVAAWRAREQAWLRASSTVLVSYAFSCDASAGAGDALCQRNLERFLERGVDGDEGDDARVHFIFSVLGGAELPPALARVVDEQRSDSRRYRNVLVRRDARSAAPLCHWSRQLTAVAFQTQQLEVTAQRQHGRESGGFLRRAYDHYVFVSSDAAGPFMRECDPRGGAAEGANGACAALGKSAWVARFVALLNADARVALASPSVACGPSPHAQLFAFAFAAQLEPRARLTWGAHACGGDARAAAHAAVSFSGVDVLGRGLNFASPASLAAGVDFGARGDATASASPLELCAWQGFDDPWACRAAGAFGCAPKDPFDHLFVPAGGRTARDTTLTPGLLDCVDALDAARPCAYLRAVDDAGVEDDGGDHARGLDAEACLANGGWTGAHDGARNELRPCAAGVDVCWRETPDVARRDAEGRPRLDAAQLLHPQAELRLVNDDGTEGALLGKCTAAARVAATHPHG